MTLNQYEKSTEDSRPVELYEFRLGGSITRVASGEDDITVDGVTYTALPVMRDAIKLSDSETNALEVKVPSTMDFVRDYIGNVPGQEATLVVSRMQRPDTVTQEVVTLYQGYVSSVKFTDQGRVATLAVSPLRKRAARTGPRCKFSGQCNNTLGDDLCQVNLTQAIYRLASGQVTAVNGNVITVTGVAAYGDGFFTGGSVSDLPGTEGRMVISQTGDDLTLTLPFPTDVVTVGSNVEVTAGCGHTTTDCHDKFNNLSNFGGFPFVPDTNPFTNGIEPRNC